MSWLIHNADGQAVSIGTVLADPLPAGLTAVELTEQDYAAVRSGAIRWDAATLALVDAPPAPAPIDVATEAAALRAEIEALEAPVLTGDVLDIITRTLNLLES